MQRKWAGAAVALRTPGEDAMVSRLSTYSHPLAGRSVAWHVLRALSLVDPPASQILLAMKAPSDPAMTAGLPAGVVTLAEPEADWWAEVMRRLAPDVDRLLLVDAAAAALSRSLTYLVREPGGRTLFGSDGCWLAAWLDRSRVPADVTGDAVLECFSERYRRIEAAEPAEAFLIRDRASLARANTLIRDRIVRQHMEAGVTFLAPETVLVDVDVAIEQDTVIYPGVILEGQTYIGAETVVGPGCRIIDSRIGRGAELKGWNYIARSTIRNRYVLEPYVRRGFD